MTVANASDISSPTIDLIKHGINHAQTVNSDQVLYNRIKEGSEKSSDRFR